MKIIKVDVSLRPCSVDGVQCTMSRLTRAVKFASFLDCCAIGFR